jgi:parvulin-like peptidyl-prolyl isomerase
MKRSAILVGLVSAGILAACDGFKEAMTAHVDVVARAEKQELSVTRLSEMIGNSQVPVRREFAKAVADLWVDYQLLGAAAARGDSLADTKQIDQAMWAEIQNARASKFYDQISKTWTTGDPQGEARYNQGELLAARHILLAAPEQGLSTAARDSVRRRAEALRTRVTPANFAEMAKQNTMDPGSKENGGLYAGFHHGDMVPEFEKALLAVKPGEITPVVKTPFGFHIIYRPRYAEVKEQLAQASEVTASQAAESTYLAKLEQTGKIDVKANAPKVFREVAQDLEGHRTDRTVIATSTAGDFTAGRLAQWIQAYPPQQRAQLLGQLPQVPDSVLPHFVKSRVVADLVIKQADSANVQLDSAELSRIRDSYRSMVNFTFIGLGVTPQSLRDSAASPNERERVASARVEDYMDRLLQNKSRYVEVPPQLHIVLRRSTRAR